MTSPRKMATLHRSHDYPPSVSTHGRFPCGSTAPTVRDTQRARFGRSTPTDGGADNASERLDRLYVATFGKPERPITAYERNSRLYQEYGYGFHNLGAGSASASACAS